VFTFCIACLAKIEIRAGNTLVAISYNWRNIAAVTSDIVMNGFFLSWGLISRCRCRSSNYLDWLGFFLFLLLQFRKYHCLSELSNLRQGCKDLLLDNLTEQLLLFFLLEFFLSLDSLFVSKNCRLRWLLRLRNHELRL